MATAKQEFLEQITNIHGADFGAWQGWERLMAWIKRQPWADEFLGDGKIPSRLLHPDTLAEELAKYLGG